MATLCLADDSRGLNPRIPTLTSPGLRDWLGGDWGLLFSHPDDFQYRGFEFDRWLAVMRAEFRGRGVRPLVCATAQPTGDGSWVSALTEDRRLIRLHGAPSRLPSATPAHRSAAGATEEVVDLAARLLRADLAALAAARARFAVIVDSTLRRRGVLRYGAVGTAVSPLDLLASIEAMRRSPAPSRAAVRGRAAA